MSVTSCPAFVRRPPTTLPIAPTPMMPIRMLMAADTLRLLLEGRHDLGRKALELLEDHRLRRADGLTHVDDLEPRVLVLDVHELLGDLLWWADEPRASLDGVLERRQPRLAGALRIGDRVDLLGRQAWHEAERR